MKVFYKNLNSLRFIAASLVIIHHIEQYKWFNGLHNYFVEDRHHHTFLNPLISLFGKLGVNIFFVLSGFLITSLLVIEKEKYQRIDIGKFYMRRVLRIWPLYFLIAILSIFILPHFRSLEVYQMANPFDHLVPNVLLIFLFLPNIQLVLYRAIAYEAQAWSIGVEEQFYLVWPVIMNFTKSTLQFKKVVAWLLSIYLFLKLAFYIIPMFVPRWYILADLDDYLSYIFQIDCMMLGAFFALLNLNTGFKKFITQKYIQVITYVALAAFIGFGLEFDVFLWEVYGILFGIIITNLVNAETSIVSLEIRWMDYLGKISYSMYMFHTLMINIVIRFITTKSIGIYPLSFLFTIVISILSYEYFEKAFLKWKSGYAKVQSGSDPKVGM
jgi:peptidoglycan/LPS O-acetylase OafA/YrhL